MFKNKSIDLMDMDEQLEDAAKKGDVEFLKKAFAVQASEYFLTLDCLGGRTILHYAAAYKQVEFMKEAMNNLPTSILKQLLLIADSSLCTPLHEAALSCDISVIKCVREMYALFSWDDDEDDQYVKPWLALSDENETPLSTLTVSYQADEDCIMEMLLIDPELESLTLTDRFGKTPLFYALTGGLNLVAEKILMSPLGPTSLVNSPDFSTLFAQQPGNIVRLLKKSGYLDNDGNTPLHSALYSRSTEELALQTLSTHPAWRIICNDRGESPFFLAVRSGCEQVVDKIISIEEPRFHNLRRCDGTTVLHCLSSYRVKTKTAQMLLEKYWWIMKLRDGQGKMARDYAQQENNGWLVHLLTYPSIIDKQDFDWMEACERNESDAILAFIDTCEDLQSVLQRDNYTLLHHVKLRTYDDYLNILKVPSIAELKNTTDHYGATPLHRALERKDMHFARALLCDNEVNRMIQDRAGTTSMDVLANLCKENNDWENMCKEINVNPYLRTTYILPGTNLEQMRTTLSVIAALLATITFAAGFTLPGGINSDNGRAVLGKKAAFLVFLLADAYAMCTSMLVLFCLVWSMVSEHGMARLLVDRSVFILMQSLYATLLVFVTGIFVVIEHTSLWAAIVIFVMCSIIGITANRTILHKVIGMFVPAAYREKLDEMRLLEEGNAGAFTRKEDNRSRRE